MPPNGFVIKGTWIPDKTTIAAQIIFPKKRAYADISYLSSSKPIATANAPATKIGRKIGCQGKKNMLTAIAIYIGSPPARGKIFL